MLAHLSSRFTAGVERRGPGRRDSDRQQRLGARRLRSAFIGAPNGIALLDPHGAIVECNPALCALLGCVADALADVALMDMVHPDDAGDVRRLLADALLRPRPTTRSEIRCVRADGTLRWAEMSVSHVEDDAGANWTVAQIQDVQDRHEAGERLRHSEERNAVLADELRRRNAELLDSNLRLRSFASQASHDLSAPLATVSGVLAQLLRRSNHRVEPQDRALLCAAREGAEGMRELVEELLQYARGAATTLHRDEVDLGCLVAEEADSLRLRAGAGGALVRVETLPTVYADPKQLLRVVRNLLDNGVKFAQPNVRPELHVDARRRPHHWEIGFGDNGVGIADADRERIFRPLERAGPRSKSGSGLGLAICAEIVARHGGEIWVEAGRDGGSRFAFTLPDVPPRDSPEHGRAHA